MEKKKNEKQQKKEKIKNVLKWVACGVGWTALLGAFVGLLVLGLKGCQNKQQINVTTTPIDKRDEPSRVVTFYDNTTQQPGNQYNQYAPRVEVLLGANTSGTSHSVLRWNGTPGRFDNIVGSTEIISNVTLFSLYASTLDGHEYEGDITRIVHETESLYLDFYDGSDRILRIDQRDFDQANVWDEIILTARNFSIEYIEGQNSNIAFLGASYGSIGSEIYSVLGIDNVLLSFLNYEVIYSGGGGGGSEPSGSGLEGVFGLISQTFGAIATFFMIQVIPGVTLSTFIILPLVSIAILFVVKLFKR